MLDFLHWFFVKPQTVVKPYWKDRDKWIVVERTPFEQLWLDAVDFGLIVAIKNLHWKLRHYDTSQQ